MEHQYTYGGSFAFICGGATHILFLYSLKISIIKNNIKHNKQHQEKPFDMNEH